jgi:cyclopropane fatty-acyl-phospholipid synthase-like methyltransferase
MVHGQLWALRPVAELGCGDGVLTHCLLHHDPAVKVDAYDLSKASLELSRALIATLDGAADRYRLLQINLNVEALPEGCYDAVLTTGCMHHIENLDQHWLKYFDLETIALGGIHDFQYIVVLGRRSD